MMFEHATGVMPAQATRYESGQPLAERAVVVEDANILGQALTGMPRLPLPCAFGFGACAIYDTQLREELAALREQEREKAEYMRMLVHELRSPVTTSKALAAALRYAHPEDPELNPVLDRIERRMEHLLDLVDDILHLSAIKAGHPLGELVACDLGAETRAICWPYLEEAAAKGLSTKIDLPASPVTVRIAPQVYQLILSNLVSNAVKYTPTGSVEVALRREGPWAVLDVRDSGIGIPAGEIPQLFTEFFRASNARRSRIPGTGLGLAGVKALVERCGGELELESQEGQGSRFTVRIPMRPPAARP